jgi:glycosyltransferase involved in cell wall biosynthesis
VQTNILVVSSRFPWPPYSGDRKRASIWLEAVAPNANVALVAPPGDVPAGLSPFRFFPALRSRFRFARAAADVLRRGRPVQSILAAPFVWDRAIENAHRAMGPFGATIVILSRADAWVRPSLNGGVHILDSIDSLRRSAEERGRAAWGPMRYFWRHEARRLARTEQEIAHAYDHVVIVSEEEIGEFGDGAIAITNSVRITPLDEEAPRRFDIGFWGRLPYFANLDAARWLLDKIVPALRERIPNITIAMGGADAPRGLRAAAERARVDFQSPIDDIATFARGVRVAIAPMRYGSGQLSKLIEAAEAGCAIVATPQALRGLPHIARYAAVASDAASIASSAADLLSDDARRAAMAKALRREAEEHYSHQRAHRGMAKLAGASGSE